MKIDDDDAWGGIDIYFRIQGWRQMMDGVPLESSAYEAAQDMDRYLNGYVPEQGQARHHSLLEALGNTFTGFAVSYVAWIPVSLYVLHRPWHAAEGLWVTVIFTVLSIARNYLIRRFFNHVT